MSYTPTNWQAGDVITPVRLNKMEQGIANAGGSVVLHSTEEYDDQTGDFASSTINDATAGEIWAMVCAGTIPLLMTAGSEVCSVTALSYAEYAENLSSYTFAFGYVSYTATGSSSSPTYQDEK